VLARNHLTIIIFDLLSEEEPLESQIASTPGSDTSTKKNRPKRGTEVSFDSRLHTDPGEVL